MTHPESEASPANGLAEGFAPHPIEQDARFRSRGLFDGRPLWAQLADRAATTPDAPAVTDAAAGTSFTYRELLAAADRQAAALVAAGLEPGDRIVLQLSNTGVFTTVFFGALRAGVVPVMALPAHRINEIAHLATVSGAVAYVTEDGRSGYDYQDLADALIHRAPTVTTVLIDGDAGPHDALPDVTDPSGVGSTTFTPADVDPSLPALFLVSGGTTGLPKLIARTHDDYAFNARRSAEIAELTSADVYLAALPAAHNFPLCCPGILGVVATGGHLVLTPDPSPDNAFGVIEKYGVTVTSLVPALAQLWCAATEWEPADISSLRLLQVGGSKLAASDAAALDSALGAVVQQVFGMAEGLICYTRLDDPRPLVHVSQGAPMSEFDEVRIVDEAGAEVTDGEEGELLVRGPYTIRGYYRAPEHNARSFTADGFYRSGDLVRRLESGHLAVTGRIKDTIVRAGENVAADDVEENLLAHPSVAQAAVVGVADESLGERICAILVLGRDAPTVDLPELRAFLTERGLAGFKLPDQVRFADSLPVTAVGKIDKKAVSAALAATAAG